MCLLENMSIEYEGTSKDLLLAAERQVNVTLQILDRTLVDVLPIPGPYGPFNGPGVSFTPGKKALVTVRFDLGIHVDDYRTHDELGRRLFRMQVLEDERLHHLVFDEDAETWYITCGGEKLCWWCRDDEASAREMESDDEGDFAFSLVDVGHRRYDYDDPFSDYGDYWSY